MVLIVQIWALEKTFGQCHTLYTLFYFSEVLVRMIGCVSWCGWLPISLGNFLLDAWIVQHPGFLSTSLAAPSPTLLDCELQETWTSFTAVSPGLNSAWHMVGIQQTLTRWLNLLNEVMLQGLILKLHPWILSLLWLPQKSQSLVLAQLVPPDPSISCFLCQNSNYFQA